MAKTSCISLAFNRNDSLIFPPWKTDKPSPNPTIPNRAADSDTMTSNSVTGLPLIILAQR